MNKNNAFKKQIDEGAIDFFLYGVEVTRDYARAIDIRTHRGSLDTFPSLIYLRSLGNIPIFRESL